MIAHTHHEFRLRWPTLVGLLALLHLPYGWLVVDRELPHDAECTADVAVLRED